MCNVVIFLLGSALQTGATSQSEDLFVPISIQRFTIFPRPVYLFVGRAVAGLAVGALTHVIPMYLAEISSANVRGSLVSLQQLSITIGVGLRILARIWDITYWWNSLRANIPYTGPLLNGQPTFDPYTNVPTGGCTGQTQASWRIPIGFQMFPALVSVAFLEALSLSLTSV
ncbi:hypothetical protein JVT61DRAFT_3113 [Boletus reticuloceps]|uniref:Major facilitator superfamily (MFS) profile domain-containing protein n=1 Tax=Boletus reticuloceps TaxID=495285 RepID=A0A8I2YP70_9AGAM|nr:hypothetical protein JVT61DRAFT_3113 [Boletus reticuloceps]